MKLCKEEQNKQRNFAFRDHKDNLKFTRSGFSNIHNKQIERYEKMIEAVEKCLYKVRMAQKKAPIKHD